MHYVPFITFPTLSVLLFSLAESLFGPIDLQAPAALIHPEPLCSYYGHVAWYANYKIKTNEDGCIQHR